jgi:antagonist of KipI
VSVRVAKPGALSTLQDLGRFGYQRFGVVVGGAMDAWSHRAANLLVGNCESEATLEITLIGPSLTFAETALIALCGADLSPRVGECPLPLGRPALLRAGSQLDFGRRQSGCRAYLAVRGGFHVAPVMDSKSTYLRGGFGGFHGRALRRGDEIPIGADDAEDYYPGLGRMLRESGGPFYAPACALVPPFAIAAKTSHAIRVVGGQQWEALTDGAQAQFVSAAFRITPNSDRMGYRLEGPKLELREPIEMISEGVTFGTIQLPPDGNAIVLMADRQTTGGYPKIANVATVDLPLLAQMVPGQSLSFEMISLDEAQRLYLAREQDMGAVAQAIQRQRRGP